MNARNSRRIYCDYNATAPLRPEAREAMSAAVDETGNPSSVHAEGRRARAVVERARETVAAAIGACRDDIAFVSGGTEAVGAALRGAMAATGAVLVTSAIEHDAVTSLAVGAEGGDPGDWPVNAAGVVDLGWLERRVAELKAAGRTPLVSLMLVNNETGVIQPVAEAAKIVHATGGLIHCDAIQGLGRIEVSTFGLDVDYLSVSAHKIGGPQGAGAFYVKPGAPFRAVQTGGGQEFGRRAGTENVAAIAGFGAACDAALAGMADYAALAGPREAFEARLKAAAPGLAVHGEAASRVGGVCCFGVEGLPSETQIMGLDLAGFAVSAGSACSSGKVKPSRVLTAMGLSDTGARSAIRASFGWASRAEDFEALAGAWLKMAARARPGLVKQEALANAS
ncbi:MAG: aminotransferase class V-fold PLP-dependent enzyme [Alphaproteobacteria bacterium]|nr:aminotransferase class V-fold PLP-dependent enzyme [Alphaproteobacteria bacterium]